MVKVTLEAIGGFDVDICDCGEAAVQLAPRTRPDLILLDVMMPGMDGPTTFAALRELPETADVPIVFMTAKTQPRELERFHALGVAGVIAKPFDPMALTNEIVDVWQQHVPGSY